MRTITTAAALVAALTTPAMAADLGGPKPAPAAHEERSRPVIGCYVQALASATIARTEASDPWSAVTIASDGYGAALGGGCDARLGQVAVGALARIELADIKSRLDNTTVGLGGTSYMAAGRVGYYVNPAVMAYGLAGMHWTDLDLGAMSVGRRGLVWGIGAEIALTSHMALTAEWTRASLGRLTEDAVRLEPTADTLRLGITVRLY